MAWFAGRVSLGNFPDLTGAVNKISEGVKNFEKNFDSALGFEEKSESSSEGLWPSTSDNKALFEPMMAFVGQKGAENTVDSPKKCDTLQHPSTADNKSPLDEDPSTSPVTIEPQPAEEAIQAEKDYRDAGTEAGTGNKIEDSGETDDDSHKAYTDAHGVDMNTQPVLAEQYESNVDNDVSMDSFTHSQQKEGVETESPEKMQLVEIDSGVDVMKHGSDVIASDDSHSAIVLHGSRDEHREGENENVETNSPAQTVVSRDIQSVVGVKNPDSRLSSTEEIGLSVELSKSDVAETLPLNGEHSISAEEETAAIVKSLKLNHEDTSYGNDTKSQDSSSGASVPEAAESFFERETLKREMKMMESALQGAARQAQAKADEIAKLMNENEQLKAGIEDLRRKSNDETESLRVEYHQRLATLERKVYALTKERDTLRREQNKKTDAAALLKEKDEIINQVMAEGEELSKKQATQEATIRKLRAQIRELEEEKKGLITKLQVEENKVDSIKKDKATTEKLLQETIEKHHSELAGQKEYYTDALAAAKEAEALAEARANNEARNELESRLKEVEERESMLVQTLEELRQTLSRKEQQAVFREDMLRRDVEDLQKRYQASERRCEELITQVPESTRPLLRQIEAMQETTVRRAEAWAAVERSLNSRLQEEEAKAAVAEERERSINERLSQTLSRINVLEAQISCLRAEQTQLTKSLEKERHRAAENRQDYLAAKEEADTHEGRANQLEEEIRELRKKHKQELHEAVASREILQQELEREKSARLDLERASRLQSSAATDLPSPARHSSAFENGKLIRKLSSTSSLSSMEESYYLQASLDSSDRSSERKNHGETTLSPYYMKSMTPNAFEAALRQKEGELTSYMSRLVSMESIRDSLAEELVKITAQCEKLKMEAAKLPGIHAELDALRRRHSAALELMGERDEELEELRADIVDLKEMYREQVNLLVNKIQVLSSSMRSS